MFDYNNEDLSGYFGMNISTTPSDDSSKRTLYVLRVKDEKRYLDNDGTFDGELKTAQLFEEYSHAENVRKAFDHPNDLETKTVELAIYVK